MSKTLSRHIRDGDNIVGCPESTDKAAANSAAERQSAWQFRAPDRLLLDLQAAANAKASTQDNLKKSCADWIGSQLPVGLRRRLNRATNEQRSGHITAGLILLLALCGWVADGDDGARRAVLAGLPSPAAPPVLPHIMSERFGARRLYGHEAPQLFAILELLCRRANISRVPEIYVLPNQSAMNAYALGSRDGAAITMTDGLLAGMTRSEIAAIIAHELAHISNDDGWTMSLAGGLQRAIIRTSSTGLASKTGGTASALTAHGVLSNAPAIGELLCLALSRNRELAADALALDLIADPRALASALEKLDNHHPAQPCSEYADFDSAHLRYLQSHPPTSQRVSYLHSLS